MKLPTASEINPIPEDLDGQHAVKNFLGKSLDEAEALLRESHLRYSEDLMFMGPIAFRYYIPAEISYIRSELPNAHPPTLFGFAGILGQWLEFQPDELIPVAKELAEICGDVLERYARFDELSGVIKDIETLVPGWPFDPSLNLGEVLNKSVDIRVQFRMLREAFSRMA